MWFVYILRCQGGRLYTGIAKDPAKRFLEHKKGSGGAYTRSHKPIRIKRWPKQKKLKLPL